ncbi:hypothetical protein GKC33_02195 [Lactobacillus salivarius]|uniref:Uncharacterized protein n=1 Tax=Ligilactobacillus salivarius TaxID=1624 RepID=A0A089RZP5_9LACO|nr:Hypothetical protein LSJ_4070 [Ligilactobacillus salivarius]MSE07571.1 hypothetical protein [Ligilactobacillus salivarius]
MSKKYIFLIVAIVFYEKLIFFDHDTGSYIGDGIFLIMSAWYTLKLDSKDNK